MLLKHLVAKPVFKKYTTKFKEQRPEIYLCLGKTWLDTIFTSTLRTPKRTEVVLIYFKG